MGAACYVCVSYQPWCGHSSAGRASASQAEGRGFEPRCPLHSLKDLTVATVLDGKHPRLRPNRQRPRPSGHPARPCGGSCRAEGVKVLSVASRSAAHAAGLHAGDVVTGIDRAPITDFLDFYLASFGPEHAMTVRRGGRRREIAISRGSSDDLGIEIETGRVTPCNNRCVFCFVDQLPRGLRPALYVKDEDYRLSFLHGNYLTLTNLRPKDEVRITEHHLSPLYVSVHATDEAARARLLGRAPREAILKTLKRLAARGTRFHAQVVVVPGLNDGVCLDRTLEDLLDPGHGLLSVAVVPVGLTRHRKGLAPVRPVTQAGARAALDQVARHNRAARKLTGRGFVYASDELFILAGRPIPAARYYDDFPQMENGVGLARNFLGQVAALVPSASLRGRRLALVTGVLARPFVDRLSAKLLRSGVEASVIPVENRLFGPSVTVSGLVAGRDVLKTLAALHALKTAPGYDAVVLPPDMVNSNGVTLDDFSIRDLARRAGAPVVVAEASLMVTLEKVEATLARQ